MELEELRDVTGKIKLILSNIMSNKISPKDIGNDVILFGDGLALDSIDSLELLPSIEKEFGVNVPIDHINVMRSVNTLTEYIIKEKNRASTNV
tara:strand:- start:10405 stop:10683 length:279 start_codon:yes stop_codon:yes gene_type:complete